MHASMFFLLFFFPYFFVYIRCQLSPFFFFFLACFTWAFILRSRLGRMKGGQRAVMIAYKIDELG
jgi:hypothetical protein